MLRFSWSFHKKIFACMVIAALVPMLVGYLAMIQVFNYTYEKNLREEAENTLSAVSTSMDVGFQNIYEAVSSLSHNELVWQMLKNEDEQDDFLAYRELFALTSAYGEYADFCIYDENGVLRISMDRNEYMKEKLPLDWSVLYESTNAPQELIVRNARIYRGADKEEFLRVAQAVQDEKGNICGYVVAVVLNEHFDYILKGTGSEKRGLVYAQDDFHEVIFASDKDSDTEEFRRARDRLRSLETPEELSGAEFAYYHTYLPEHGVHVFYRQPIETLKQLKNNLISIAVITGSLSLFFCLFLSGSFSNVFYEPLQQMQEAMNSLVIRERELSEANIKMMQAQLNPHFIYNTLDTMKWIGKANQLPEVAVLSSGLAKILRTSISAGQTVTLRQETELVESYVEIQKIRFEDKFEFLVDIPGELMEAIVPKLILQPIVENSILHGFEGRDHGMVLLQAELDRERNRLFILVQDDGVGVDRVTLERLNRHAPPEKTEQKESKKRENSSIGFYNVNEIIRLNYGEEYGLYIEAVPLEGTKVRYELPFYTD